MLKKNAKLKVCAGKGKNAKAKKAVLNAYSTFACLTSRTSLFCARSLHVSNICFLENKFNEILKLRNFIANCKQACNNGTYTNKIDFK